MKERRCEACHKYGPIDRSHIRSRGAGSGWLDFEWIYCCRVCHNLSGAKGWRFFLDKYPHVEEIFKSKGWHLIEEGEDDCKVWKLRRI
jgi:hypothetical protein